MKKNFVISFLFLFSLSGSSFAYEDSCQSQSQAKKFGQAFVAADLGALADFFHDKIIFIFDTAEFDSQLKARSMKKYQKILKKINEYQIFRIAPDPIDVEKNKITFGGKNFNSLHNHWILRGLDYECQGNEFRIKKVYLVDGL